jgi:YfiH family protein
MRLLRSPLLHAFPHGFTTRQGGASPAPWDALNLGGAVGDDPARVAENWRRLAAATGLAFARVRQVHGAEVARLEAPTDCSGLALPPSAPEADAVLTTTRGLAACVSVADCVPILIGDPRSGAVAAVHAGWRGTLARTAAAGVAALVREVGAAPDALLAAVGPSIGPCCYAVSADLAERFAVELGPGLAVGPPEAPRLDLWAANARVLAAAGVAAERVDVLRRCTACDRDTFFSHRRDRGRTGRQVAFIAPPDPTAGGALP